jgi:tRNA A-37 threonylcarbamoyl transferase component Bud32
MAAEEVVTYRDGDLSGECLADYVDLVLRDIPWDTLKRRPDARYRLIKSSHSRRVVSFPFVNRRGAEEIVFAKRYRVRSVRKGAAQIFIPSKARREWRRARELQERTVSTAVPLLYAETRRGIFRRESYIVTRGLTNFVCVRDALKQIPYRAAKKLVSRIAAFVRAQHDAGFYHDDFSTRHVFLKGDPLKNEPAQFALIDLDNAKVLDYVSLYRRLKNIFQLMRSFPDLPWRQRISVALFDAYFSGVNKRRQKRRLIKLLNFISWFKREEPMIRLK